MKKKTWCFFLGDNTLKKTPGLFLPGLIIVMLGLAWAAAPQSAEACHLSKGALETMRRLAIQYNGRVKPFDSFAREVLTQMTGEERWQGQDPTTTVLSLIANPEEWQSVKLLSVPFGPLREPLGLDKKAARVSYAELIATRALMKMLPPIVAKQQRGEKLTMLENETMDMYYRFVGYSGLMNGEGLRFVPPSSALDRAWTAVDQPAHFADERIQPVKMAWTRLSSGNPPADAEASALAATLSGSLRALNPAAYPAAWRLDLECLYNRVKPFRIAWKLYALALVGLLLGLPARPCQSAEAGGRPSRKRLATLGLAALGVAWAVHTAGIVTRVILAQRAPVSNMYETMFWLAFVLVTLALVFEAIYRARFFAVAASMVAIVALYLADYLPLDPSINPLVAVLRSNKWLIIHVLTIVASYGALSLAAGLAHLYGGFYIASGGRHKTLPQQEQFIYRAIQVGVLLLTAGIMLGGVWANASWGRYWGWDPKETWALITLLWFLAILHGRHAGWLRGVGVASATIGGFLLLLMTYYGVNYFLVGLHSYAGGHAKPISPLLIGYLVAEGAFLLWIGLTARSTHPVKSR